MSFTPKSPDDISPNWTPHTPDLPTLRAKVQEAKERVVGIKRPDGYGRPRIVGLEAYASAIRALTLAEVDAQRAGRDVLITGGGDWYDASADLLWVPTGVDIAEEKQRREAWYRDEYVPALRAGNNPRYMTFVDWLREKCGATDSAVETFDD